MTAAAPILGAICGRTADPDYPADCVLRRRHHHRGTGCTDAPCPLPAPEPAQLPGRLPPPPAWLLAPLLDPALNCEVPR